MCFFFGLTFLFLFYYIVFLWYFGKGFRQLKPGNNPKTPVVSVIVPARNESKNLPFLFHALEQQNYPREKLEIVLVDDRSEDATYLLMDHFAKRHSHVKVIRITQKTSTMSPKKYALTQGIQNAKGEIIVTTDADAHPGSHWVATLMQYYTPETGMVIGYAPYRTDGPYDTLFHRLLALEYFSLAAVACATAKRKFPTTCNGANLSFRKKVFEEVGGYGEKGKWLSGDDDLFLQTVFHRTSWKIDFAMGPDAAVFNNPPRTVGEWIRQRLRFSSKHLAYPWRVKWVLGGIYAFYVFLLSATILAIFRPNLFPLVLGIWGIKSLSEVIFLRKAKQKLEQRPLLRYYPLACVLHVLYVVFFPLLGQWIKPKWK